MLLRENYTAEHIAELRRETGADPSILERTVFAFGLLEAIRSVDMPFIFKGGTSLMVLLNEPRRLSTDIDIIVEHGTDVDSYIEKAGRIFPFVSVEENKRKGANDIEKRHFRFRFLSPRTGKEINILLDVVFEDNPYLKVTEKPIRSNLLLREGEDFAVNLPDKNCILGDTVNIIDDMKDCPGGSVFHKVPWKASFTWDEEGNESVWELERDPTEDLDFELWISIEHNEKHYQYAVRYADFCYAVAKACTEVLKKHGFTGYHRATYTQDINIRQLLFLKGIALGDLDACKLRYYEEDAGETSDLSKELELLLFDM